MQNKAKVVATRFLVVCIDWSVDIDVFDERQSLKARIHETDGTFVDFIVR